MATQTSTFGHIGGGEITQQDIDELTSLIGVEYPIPPGVEVFNGDVFRDYATYCIANANPLWCDEAYARAQGFPSRIGPPTVEYVVASRDVIIGGFGMHDRGIMGLHMSDDWELIRPVVPGDRIRAAYSLAGIKMRESRHAAGQAMEQTIRMEFRDAEDELVSVWTRKSFRAKRAMNREGERNGEAELYRYSDDEIAAIQRGIEAETVRGAEPRKFGSVKVGDSIGTVVKGPFTMMDMICWWIGAKGPFLYPFRMKHEMFERHAGLAIIDPDTNIRLTPEDSHWDPEYAKRNGVGGLYDAGKQRTASITHLASNWMGDAGRLKRIYFEMRKPNMVGDTTWYSGSITETNPADRTVTAAVEGRNQRGVVHSKGHVVIELPE